MKKMDNAVILTEDEYKGLCKLAESGKEASETAKAPRISRICTSKKILIIVWSISIILIGVSIYGFLFTEKDITPIVTLTGVVTAAAGTDTAMYSWKAKAENKIKLTLQMVKELADKHGIENVVSLAGIVLSD